MKILFILNIFILVLGYGREILILNYFGIGILSDQYVIINKIALMINLELFNLFSAYFILKNSSKKILHFINFMKFTILVAFLQFILLLINIIIQHQFNLIIFLSILSLTILPFFTIAISFYKAYLEVYQSRYYYGSLLKVFISIFIIFSLLLFGSQKNIFIVVVSIIIAYIFVYFIGFYEYSKQPYIYNNKNIFSLIQIFKDSVLNKLILYAVTSQLITFIELFLLSFLSTGYLTIFHYSTLFYVVLLFFYINIILTYYFPKISLMRFKNDKSDVIKKINKIIFFSSLIYIIILFIADKMIDTILPLILNIEKEDIFELSKTISLLFFLVIPSIVKETIKIFFRSFDLEKYNIYLQLIILSLKFIIAIPMVYFFQWYGFIYSYIGIHLIAIFIYILFYIKEIKIITS